MSIVIISGSNPDSASISKRETIDISFSLSDVSASLLSASIKTNYNSTGNTIVVPRYETPVPQGQVYYAPMYTEKLNYEQWLKTVNKTFVELN
jgi:hypothetical protein